MICFSELTEKEKRYFKKTVEEVKSNKTTLPEKMYAIKLLQQKIGKPVLQEAYEKFAAAQKIKKESPKIELTDSEKEFASNYKIDAAIERADYLKKKYMDKLGEKNIFALLKKYNELGLSAKEFSKMTKQERWISIAVDSHAKVLALKDAQQKIQEKGVKTYFDLDGKKYVAIHSDNSVRVVAADTGITVGEYGVKESDNNDRIREILPKVDKTLVEKFENPDPSEYIPRGLPDRIIHELRKQYPVKENGEIPIQRKLFSVKSDRGLFAEHDFPFRNIVSSDESASSLETILEYLPRTVRSMIENDNNPQEKVVFIGKLHHFANIMNSLEVPVEEVWEPNFELNEFGSLVQKKKSLYRDPNYLQLLGKFEEVERKGPDGKKIKSYRLKLDPQIDEIIRFYSMKAMSGIKEAINNISTMDDNEISKKFGLDQDAIIELRNKYLPNGLVPIAMISHQAAVDAFSQIAINVSADFDIRLKEGIIASLDSLIRATIANSEYAIYANSSDTIEAMKENVRKQYPTEGLSGEMLTKRNEIVREKLTEIDNFGVLDGKRRAMFKLNEEAFNLVADNKVVFTSKDVFEVVNKLRYINASDKRTLPSETPILVRPKFMRKTNYETTPL